MLNFKIIQMAQYLNAKPFICVKSSVFFEFQARRMEELFGVQMHMNRCAPDNLGTMTALFMHLIRHVNHSPIAMAPYLRDTLRELLFSENIERFGMFFLPSLDLDNGTINGIMKEDSLQCRKDMTGSIRAVKSRPATNLLNLTTEPSSQFPIGNAPSWADIIHVLYHEPMKLLHTWIWDPDWDTDDIAAKLFLHFTRQFWLTIQEDRITSAIHVIPDPDNLEEAMKTWTVPSLLSTLTEITCLPSSHGLKGKFPGKGHRAFRDWVDIFFPTPEKSQHKESVWKELYTRGYIKEFHDHLLDMSPRQAADLQTRLGDIFEQLQCIPIAAPSTPTTPGQLWKTADQRILFFANPLHYKIERVAPRTRAGTTVFRVKASRNMINARLDKELDGVDVGDGQRARRRLKNAHKRQQARKSAMQKNRRDPPNRTRTNKTAADVDIEQDRAQTNAGNSDPNHPIQLSSPIKRATRKLVLSSEEDYDSDPTGYNRDQTSGEDYLPSWNVMTQPNSNGSGDEMDEDDDMEESDGGADEDYDMDASDDEMEID
jgi:hypothetical protein